MTMVFVELPGGSPQSHGFAAYAYVAQYGMQPKTMAFVYEPKHGSSTKHHRHDENQNWILKMARGKVNDHQSTAIEFDTLGRGMAITADRLSTHVRLGAP